jgi:hypothetical protein
VCRDSIDWKDLVPGDFPGVPETSPICEAAKEMVVCLNEGQAPSSDGHDGRAALEIIMAFYESQRKGNVPITLPLPSGPSSLHRLREEGLL